MLQFSKLDISTCSCIANIDTIFDIENIYNFLNIDDVILGIKYKDKYKGNIKPNGTIFNQVTLKIYIRNINKDINIKVFKNGAFQISGIKNLYQAKLVIQIFLYKIIDIRGTKIIPVKVINNIIYNEEQYNKYKNDVCSTRYNSISVYDNNTGTIIAERKTADIFILYNNIRVELYKKKYFIEIKHLDLKKRLYNLNGVCIGIVEYKMNRKRKNLFLFKCTYSEVDTLEEDGNTVIYDDIHDKYNNHTGLRITTINSNIVNNISDCDNRNFLKEIRLNYVSISNKEIYDEIKNNIFFKEFDSKINLKMININCFFSVKDTNNTTTENINLIKHNIHNLLIYKYNLHSYYTPESRYQAINLKLYYTEDLLLLNRIQNNNKYKYRFTVIIFQTGKILISGCKNKKQIIVVKNFIVDFLTTNYSEVILQYKNLNKFTEKYTEELCILDIY